MDQLKVNGGENDVIGTPARDVTVCLPVDAAVSDVVYKCMPDSGALKAPLEKGQVIGTIEVWYRDLCVAHSDMVAMFAVAQPGVNNIPLKPSASADMGGTVLFWGLIGVLAVVVLILLAVGVLLIMRAIRLRQLKRRHRLINERSR